MSKKPEIVQWLSLVRYKAIFKFLKKFKKKIIIVLDLEDSSKDIFDSKNTLKLKNQSRKGLIYLAQNKNDLHNLNLYVRINAPKTQYFAADIECLKIILKKNFIKGIFLPKVTDYKTIEKIDYLLNLKHNNVSIIPIIENKKGLVNLEKILKADLQNNYISKIQYGHSDYCLSERLWPFPEPYHIEYWNICDSIIKLCTIYKKQFIQSPFPIVNNPNLFNQCVEYIVSNYKKLDFAMALVNFNDEYLNIKKPKKYLKIKAQGKDKKFHLIFAKKICNLYEAQKNNKKSFSLTSKWFIPPHQYIAAKYYIHRNDKK